MENEYKKEVKFSDFCEKCMYSELKDDGSEPCNTCLETGARFGSVKPEKFVEKEKK